MASKVQICNMALAKIGSPPITSLDEGSREALACSQIYDSVRDEVLQIRPWASCLKSASLALLDDTPAFEFDYAFQLPSDFLDLVRLGEADGADINYRIEGRKLLCSQDTAAAVYIYRNTDTGTYEPVLADLISSRMAVDLAMLVANSGAMSEKLTQSYEMKRTRAKSVDGQQAANPSFTYVSFLDSRL